MKIFKSNKASGISLVALVITIIVLIILTATVIVTFMEGGIISKAKEAVFKNDIKTYQEILAVKNGENKIQIAKGNGRVIQALNLQEMKVLFPEFKDEYNGLIIVVDGQMYLGERMTLEKDEIEKNGDKTYATWLGDLAIYAVGELPPATPPGEVTPPDDDDPPGEEIPEIVVALASKAQVGDYVDYNITGGTYTVAETDRTWLFNDLDKDKVYDAGEEKITYKDLNWRVLKNDGQKVTIISEQPIENIYLMGSNAIVNGPTRLNEICAKVYGGSNIKAEDIISILHITPQQTYVSSTTGLSTTVPYGTTLGDIMESEAGINQYIVDRSYLNKPTDYKNIGLDCYVYKADCVNASDIEKDLIYGNNMTYWTSTIAANIIKGPYVRYGMRFISEGNVMGMALLGTGKASETDSHEFGIRPVVTLSASTQVVNENAAGTIGDAWQIK